MEDAYWVLDGVLTVGCAIVEAPETHDRDPVVPLFLVDVGQGLHIREMQRSEGWLQCGMITNSMHWMYT